MRTRRARRCRIAARSARAGVDESGDPIFPANQPAPFDSRLEERFAKDLGRLAPDWDVIREPTPLQAGASLIFPDFLVRQAALPAFVLCSDEELLQIPRLDQAA